MFSIDPEETPCINWERWVSFFWLDLRWIPTRNAGREASSWGVCVSSSQLRILLVPNVGICLTDC